MIDIEHATQLVLQYPPNLGEEYVPLGQSVGRILAEEVVADRDFPPFDRVTMDGIAIAFPTFADLKSSGKVLSFPVIGIQAAGAPVQTLFDPQGCLEVMTGAVLPDGTDTVIRYEDVLMDQGMATIQVDNILAGQNIHRKGTDRQRGSIILNPGKRISAAELGVAATVGRASLKVKCMPKVLILSTGDELVAVEDEPAPHQIRSSNIFTIRATLEEWGVDVSQLHLIDDPEAIRNELQSRLENVDAIIISGGVSKGKFDYVPQVLEELGVKKRFHGVRQRPGKPFWFGHWQGKCTIFALPGNPVSSFMCTHRYVGPWVRNLLGQEPMQYDYAILDQDFTFKPDLTYFLQVRLDYARNGLLRAEPIEGHGSGDLANLADADAFMELPRGRIHFPEGELFPVIKYR